MMERRRKSKRYVVWGGVLLVLIIMLVIGILVWKNSQSDNNERQNEDVVRVEEIEKNESETEEEYSERVAEEKKVKQYEGESPNRATELSGAITYSGVNDGKLMIGINIDQFLDSGKCELSLMRDNKVIYSDDVGIIADVTTSSCDGFSVPVSNLGNGNTEIIVRLSANGKEGVIRGEVDI